MGQLDGKSAVITGCASGIGLAIATTFLAEGGRVLGVDRSAFPDDLTGRIGFSGLEIDISGDDAPRTVLRECQARLGPVDILVNNAGIGKSRTILETNDEDLDRYLTINLAAPFRLCRDIVPHMRGRGGAIVNIASAYAMVGVAGSSAYVASKAGIIAMTRQLATEFGRDGIRVNSISPGLIITPMTEYRLSPENEWFRTMMIDGCPMRRAGTPEEIAKACLFLASDAASFVTGINLAVDGGWTSSKFMPAPELAVG